MRGKKSADRATELQHRLKALVLQDRWLMQVLQAAASVQQRPWCVAAGAVRNLVWDTLHGHTERTLPGDVDFLFHDTAHLSAEYEQALQARLARALPTVQWDAVNQATIHVHNRAAVPYESMAQAMRHWPEQATAVGVCLHDDGTLEVLAPFGLVDLFDMVARPVPQAPETRQAYIDRMQQKNWPARWPKVRVLVP
jgi:uncharacterized protein